MNAPTVALLLDLEEYFDQRADADAQGDPMQYVGNEEMGFLVRIRAILGKTEI